MIFFSRKTKKEEVDNRKQISFRSFKNNSVDEYEKALTKVTLPYYGKYKTKKAYNDSFFQKLIKVVNNISPLKAVRIKDTITE